MPFGTSQNSAGALATGDLHNGHTAAEATEDMDPSERFTFVVEIKSCGATASAPICIPATSSAMSEGDCRTTREFAGGAATSDQFPSQVTEEAAAWSMKQLQTKARVSLPRRLLFCAAAQTARGDAKGFGWQSDFSLLGLKSLLKVRIDRFTRLRDHGEAEGGAAAGILLLLLLREGAKERRG